MEHINSLTGPTNYDTASANPGDQNETIAQRKVTYRIEK